jgi:hypothetical protein
MNYFFVYGLMAASIPLMILHGWAEDQCTKLDVATGRRDSMALVDDYGSNRGWYWRWKIISIPAALLAAPGLLLWGATFLVLMSY